MTPVSKNDRSKNDITTDTGKLADALRQSQTTFATAGSGVELDPTELSRLHLTQAPGAVRPGHVLVWSEPEDEQ